MTTAIDSLLEKVTDEAAREELRAMLEKRAYKAPKYDAQAVHDNAVAAAQKAIQGIVGETAPYFLMGPCVVDARSKFGRFFKNLPSVQPTTETGVVQYLRFPSREIQDAYAAAYVDYVNNATGGETCVVLVVME